MSDGENDSAAPQAITFSASDLQGLDELVSLYDAVEWTAFTREPDALVQAVTQFRPSGYWAI